MSENLPAEKQIEQMIIQTTDHLKKNITFWRLYLFLVHQSDVQKKLKKVYEKMRNDYMDYVVKLFQEIGSKNLIITFTLSDNYTFPSTSYIHSELLFNNIGKTSNTFFFQPEANKLGLLTAARWSIYQEFAYDITPLLRGTFFGIFNSNDKSFVIVPSINYSIITNLDLFLITMFFEGKPLTEYGEYRTTFYARIKFSF